MPAPFTPADISNSLAASPDPRAVALARDAETVKGVWAILLASTDLITDSIEGKGKISGALVTKAFTKKALATADVANLQMSSQGVKAMTFVGSTFIGTVEMGVEALRYTSAAKAGTFITLKVAEKVVSAAGFADLDKCKVALAGLTVNAGLAVMTCVGTGGALCILGAASFALEAFNAHSQCQLPPPTI